MFRRMLSAVALIASLSVTLAAAIEVARRWPAEEPALGTSAPRPDPRQREAVRLRQELLDPGLPEWPEEQRLALALELEESAPALEDWLAGLDARQLHVLEENLAALAWPWLLDSSNRYFAQPEGQREAFVDALIGRTLARAGELDFDDSRFHWLVFHGARSEHIDRWRQQAPATDVLRVGAFILAVRERVEERFFRPPGVDERRRRRGWRR